MKNTTIIITLVLFSFGWGQNMNPSERFFSQLPQEIQDQLSQSRISWGQTPSRPITPNDRDAEDLYGEWEHEDDNATLWVTSGTDQTIPNSSQTQGQEPADGAININGPIPGSMNYMMNMGGMYGYDMVYIALSNNVFTDDYYWENMALPHYQLLYISYPEYNFAGGEFVIVDTMDGDFIEYFYEIEDADDQITVDEASFRINITDLTLSNDSGDSTYVLSGTLVPGTIDIEAGVSTAVSSPMFEDDFGPVSGDESMTWQLHENGTGLEIISGEDYYDSWSDTTELQWSANDDSMTMVFLYWDDYYYEEDSDTVDLAYNVENDTLSINATMDLCEMMDDDYYYGDCYEMLSMFLGIEDIQEALMDFDMTMSYTGEIVYVPDLQIAPININDMVYWIYKSTWYTTYGSANGVQADFPKGTGGAIYADGIVWGGMVNDGNEQSPRVGGTTYAEGLKAGVVRYGDNGNVIGSTHPDDHHIWWIRPDYQTADLTEDASMIFQTDNPSNNEIQEVYDNYAYFWQNWPTEWGAPYDDVNGNGFYDPDTDIPGVPGADQTIWVVANDVPEIVDDNGNQYDEWDTSIDLYGSDPIGIELQVTLWGYKSEAGSPLNNTVFKNVKTTYTGLVGGQADASLSSFYISQWSDPDLGTYTDDFVGVDVDRSLGFVYNGQLRDDVFNNDYNMPTPAVGYDLLLSPTGEGEESLSSFSYFGAGSNISDPDLGEYDGSLQFYNLMLGLQPRPEFPNGIPWIDNNTGEPTLFPLSGDPVFGTGDLDGVVLDPGDRRLVMSSGPLTLGLGDEVEMVIALSGAVGDNHLHSVHKLKKDNTKIQAVFNSEFHLGDYQFTLGDPVNGNRNIQVTVETDGIPTGAVCIINDYEGNNVINESLFDDGAHDDGDAADGIYSNSFDLPIASGAYNVGLMLNTPEGAIMVGTLGSVTTDGPIDVSDYQIAADNLNNDGHANPGEYVYFNFEFTNSGIHAHSNLSGNAIFSYDLEWQGDYYLNIPDLGVNQSGAMDFDLDNPFTYTSVKVPDDAEPGDTLDIIFLIRDDAGNTWNSQQAVLVEAFDEEPSDFALMEHIEGGGAGAFSYAVAYPSQATDHTYEITLETHNWDSNRDVSPSTISGTGYEIAGDSHITLEFHVDIVSPDYNYADGVRLIFPDNVEILGANEEFSSVVAMVSGNEVMFGDSSLSSGGFFSGGQILYVYVDTSAQAPINIDYVIYDDGWAQAWCVDNCETCESYGIGFDCEGNVVTETQNAEGALTITEISEHMHPEGTLLLNLKDMNTGALLLDGYNLPDQFGMNIPIIDGLRIYKGTALYDAPPTFSEYYWYGDGYYNIGDYWQHGWAQSAMAVDTWGLGTTDGNLLSRDIQIRFTGVYENEPIYDNGVYYYRVQEGTGSSAWIDGARRYDLGSQHPDPNNPGTGEPFRLQIPFEVWDMEAQDGPQQIDITIYDRIQTMTGGDEVYAFNPYDRMYTHFIHKPHAESAADEYLDESLLTWNVVWWETDWVYGDTINFQYDLSISSQDVYQFTPADILDVDKEKLVPDHYALAQNYPNPFNPLTQIKYSIPKGGLVELVVYDVLGREVRRLINTKLQAGNHIAVWDGKNHFGEHVGTGMYFYRLKAGNFLKTRKMILLK